MATDPSDVLEPSRRAALALVGRATAGACLLSLVGGCELAELRGGSGPPVTELLFDVAQAPYDALKTAPALVPVNIGSRRIMLVAVSATEIVCLDRTCTHQACDLSPDQSGLLDLEIRQIVCRCHGASYDLHGAVRSPPASGPLKSWAVTFDAATGKGKVSFT